MICWPKSVVRHLLLYADEPHHVKNTLSMHMRTTALHSSYIPCQVTGADNERHLRFWSRICWSLLLVLWRVADVGIIQSPVMPIVRELICPLNVRKERKMFLQGLSHEISIFSIYWSPSINPCTSVGRCKLPCACNNRQTCWCGYPHASLISTCWGVDLQEYIPALPPSNVRSCPSTSGSWSQVPFSLTRKIAVPMSIHRETSSRNTRYCPSTLLTSSRYTYHLGIVYGCAARHHDFGV